MQLQLIKRGKKPTDLTAYAKLCQLIYHGLKEIAHAKVFKRSMEKCAVAETAFIYRFSTRLMAIRTAKSSCQQVISKKVSRV